MQDLFRRLEEIPVNPEHILTGSGQIKSLAIIDEYLVRFEDSSTLPPAELSGHQSVARQPKIASLVCLEGLICQDYQPECDSVANKHHPNSRESQDAMSYCKHSPATTYDAPNLFGFHLKSAFDSIAGETLLFQTQEQQQRWKAKMALSCVFFADLASRFECKVQLGHKHGSRLLCMRNKSQNTSHSVRFKEVRPDYGSATTLEIIKVNMVNEARILLRLRDLRITPRFDELVHTKHGLGIVEEFLDAIPFTDWFRDTWCFGLGGAKDSLPVLGLLLELSRLLFVLHEAEVSHENISKENICVKITATGESAEGASFLHQDLSTSTPKRRGQMRLSNAASIRNSSFIQKLMQGKSKGNSAHQTHNEFAELLSKPTSSEAPPRKQSFIWSAFRKLSTTALRQPKREQRPKYCLATNSDLSDKDKTRYPRSEPPTFIL